MSPLVWRRKLDGQVHLCLAEATDGFADRLVVSEEAVCKEIRQKGELVWSAREMGVHGAGLCSGRAWMNSSSSSLPFSGLFCNASGFTVLPGHVT